MIFMGDCLRRDQMRNTNYNLGIVAVLAGLWLFFAVPGVSLAAGDQGTQALQQVSATDILRAKTKAPFLRSSSAILVDQQEGVTLLGRNVDTQHPIASLTKLMTAMVTLDAKLPLGEIITITPADRDHLRHSASRLRVGVKLTRRDTLLAALAASDNRAAAALARTYPGGLAAALRAMNAKARRLGMNDTHFADPAGLSNDSVSTASDLAVMVEAAAKYRLIHQFTTTGEFAVKNRRNGRHIEFLNTNRLVRRASWDINLSKTGYTDDAGNCLVMQAVIAARPVILVLLDSWGKLSKYGDSGRIRDWLLKTERRALRLSEANQD